ncbi:MAG: UPF0280 family protein [Paracoccaceae bacterium]
MTGWAGPQAALLPDGQRLHLHHGPIDLILWADPPARAAAYARAEKRFRTVLDELVAELPLLRSPAPVGAPVAVTGPVAQRMAAAVAPYARDFITPMAAVAGAVADEVLAAMLATAVTPRRPLPHPLSQGDTGGASGDAAPPSPPRRGAGGEAPDARLPRKAWINNGGDIAFFLSGDEIMSALLPGGRLALAARDPVRGIATSGWRGRSQSLGIADAVTVLAGTGAEADAAATVIANALDLPGHPAIARRPATEVKADSDLGARLVTVAVGPLSPPDRARALDRGLAAAEDFRARGLIHSACLFLQGAARLTAAAPALAPALSEPEPADA